jgi:hypothetical protein
VLGLAGFMYPSSGLLLWHEPGRPISRTEGSYPHQQVKWKILFFVARQKTIVATVVGNGKIYNPTKYGAKIRIFPFESPKP